jgi:ParB family transcriptional regulator, chromosome partitioning protein
MSIEAATQEYQSVPLAQLIPSKTNPRKTFDAAALNELAESIRNVGLLQPILARPTATEGIYEIVAGERRWRAAQIAEQDTIPIHVRELSDAQVIEAQVIENLIRADVHPYEEAQGFLALMHLDPARYTAQELAARTGKSITFVIQRLKLIDLIPEVADEFQKGNITNSHALQLARLTPAQQKVALPNCFENVWLDEKKNRRLVTAAQFASYIEKNITLELSKAPFAREDETLCPEAGACLNCAKRSGFNTLLFPDVKNDSCFDGACYGKKLNRFIATSNLVQLAGDYRPVPEGSQALARNQYTVVKEGEECDYATKGIVSTGSSLGSILTVCTSTKCQTHHPQFAEDDDAYLEEGRQRCIERRTKEETAKQLRKAFSKKVSSVPTADDMDLLAIMVAHAAEQFAPDLLTEWGVSPANQDIDAADGETMLSLLLDYVAKLSGKQRIAAIFEMLLISTEECAAYNYSESATVAKAAKLYHVSIPNVEKRALRKVEAEIAIEEAKELEKATAATTKAQSQEPNESADAPTKPEDTEANDEQPAKVQAAPKPKKAHTKATKNTGDTTAAVAGTTSKAAMRNRKA